MTHVGEEEHTEVQAMDTAAVEAWVSKLGAYLPPAAYSTCVLATLGLQERSEGQHVNAAAYAVGSAERAKLGMCNMKPLQLFEVAYCSFLESFCCRIASLSLSLAS